MPRSCVVLAFLAVAHIHAQPAVAQEASAATVMRTSGVSVGFEAGGLVQSETAGGVQTLWLPTVRVDLGTRFALQWEASRWTAGVGVPIDWAYREAGVAISPAPSGTVPANRTATTLGVTLRYRAGAGRWRGFVGGGVNFQRTEDRLFGRATRCAPPAFPRPGPPELCIVPGGLPSEILNWHLAPIAVGGAEFQLAGPLAAVGSVRVSGGSTPIAVGLTGGVRLSLQAPSSVADRQRHSPDRFVGQEVRVTGTDGSTVAGRLVSISANEVVYTRQGLEVSVPLDRVERVERVSRGVKKGALVGLATGAALGLLATCDTGGDDCPNKHAWVPVAMMIEGGIGAAVGAGIGAIVNRAHKSGNQLYSRASPPTVAVTPLLGVDRQSGARAGLAVGLQF
jgi:hypothetical protein